VKDHKRTEEQQKDHILELFSKCRNEIVSDRLQGSSEDLCKEIYNWYKDYLSVDVNNIGLGLVEVIIRFTKNISKIPKDKDGFFRYLDTSLTNEGVGSDREYTIKNDNIKISNNIIKIPKEKKRKRKEIKDIIEMLESQLGRRSTSDEKIQFISKWYKITDKKAIEYLELINNENVGSLDEKNNNGEEREILDTKYEEPERAFFTNFDVSIIKEAVISVLDNKQERAEPCIKALFTLHCIKNNLMELYPILDQEIIDSFQKHDKKPKQYEIYLKYHPEIDKESAGVLASTNLREFLKKIETYLKEKN